MKKYTFIVISLLILSVLPALSEAKNRIGIAPASDKIILTYERIGVGEYLNKEISLGIDLSFQYNPSEQSLYTDDVNFKTNTHVINPWIMVYLIKEQGFKPNVLIFKPSFVMLNPGGNNDNFEVAYAYEVMLGNVIEFGDFYFKFDYGFKHFLNTVDISYNNEKPAVPSNHIVPSAGLYFGVTF